MTAIPVLAVGERTPERIPSHDTEIDVFAEAFVSADFSDIIEQIIFELEDLYMTLSFLKEFDPLNSLEISAVENEILERKTLLDQLGAIPSQEMLAQLPFVGYDEIGVRNLIPDFAGFQSMFGHMFSLMGVARTVPNPLGSGTFDTYTIVIRDNVAGAGRLTTPWTNAITLYSLAINHGMTAAQWQNAIVTLGATLMGFALGIGQIGQVTVAGIGVIFPSLNNSFQQGFALRPVIGGSDNIHSVRISSNSTMYFVFVRNPMNGQWTHQYTTMSATVLEAHSFYGYMVHPTLGTRSSRATRDIRMSYVSPENPRRADNAVARFVGLGSMPAYQLINNHSLQVRDNNGILRFTVHLPIRVARNQMELLTH